MTSRGLKRRSNEDAVAAADLLLTGEVTDPVTGSLDGGRRVFAVADGVGGRQHGARASRELIANLLAQDPPDAEPSACIDAVCRAALGLHAVTMQAPETAGMATTVAGVALSGDGNACWFNVGDSRVYLLRDGRFTQLSVDDAEDGRSGSRQRSTLTRSIGGGRSLAPVIPHTGRIQLLGGDRLLLCTDGVWGPIPDARTTAILIEQPDAGAAVRTLLAAVLEAGAPDNASIALLQ